MQRKISSFFTTLKPKFAGTATSLSCCHEEESSDSPIKKRKNLKRRISESSDEERELNANNTNDLNQEQFKDSDDKDIVADIQEKNTTPPKRITANRKKKSKIEPNTVTEDKDEVSKVDKASQNVILANENKKQEVKKDVGNFFAPHKEKDSVKRVKVENPTQKNVKIESTCIGDHVESNINPANYQPNKTNYDPLKDSCWMENERVPYQALTRTFQIIEDLSARLKITSTLANLFRSVILLTPDDLLPCVYLCLNKVAPAYEGIELGIGDTVLMKVVAAATGKSLKQLKEMVAEQGDLGLVAEQCRTNQRMMFTPPKLTIQAVFSKLKDIANMSGNAAMTKKQDKIQSMFVACKNSEARYLMRSLSGKLRIGLAEQTVLTALGHAVALTHHLEVKKTSNANEKDIKECAALAIKTAYCELPNYELLIANLLKHGWQDISKYCHITPGIPLKPMLAHPSKGISEVLKRFDLTQFSCEFKYDGERAQIHILEDGKVHIYSRNQENNTSKYPDIVSRVSKICKDDLKSCILDTESVAWDKENKRILPFQVLSTRKRKDADVSDIKVQVCVYAFDLLYLNGTPLVREPFRKRRELLRSSFNEIEGEFMLAKSIVSTAEDDISEFLDESIKNNCEGLMVKTLDVHATYEIAKRSHNWLKLKKDYLDGVGDTLDLVVIGAYFGSGKRTGKYGGFLLACYDEENEEFQSICKMGTGFSDEQLAKHYEFFQEHVIDKPRSYYRYGDSITPNVWLDAVQVWEVRAADLSISPTHKAAISIVDHEKGISLRFPRFLRIREDKKPDHSTTAQQVAEMYKNQEVIKNNAEAKTSVIDEEDFY